MKLIRHIDRMSRQFRGGAVSIGNFDGVHRGHARIIERLSATAHRLGTAAVVFTFDPHPSRILRPQSAPTPLCWPERKAELLGELGVDAVVAYPTDEAFLQLGARQFFDQIIRQKLEARAIVEGTNFFFGHDRAGNTGVLRQFCAETGIAVEVVEPVNIDGEVVSSSRLRQLVAAGQIDQVRVLLTRPYRIRGTVVRGAGRGNKLGFPTVNLAQVDTLLPGEGIYAGRALAAGVTWPAAISIGANPTFDEAALKIEAYLLGYHGSLYDQCLEIEFLARLRDVQRYSSVEDLVGQMQRDVARTREIVEG